jgi:hypothetical protein
MENLNTIRKKILINGDLFILFDTIKGIAVYRYPSSPFQKPGPLEFSECPDILKQEIIHENSSKPIPRK